MRRWRALFFVVVGCSSPLTAAELRDASAPVPPFTAPPDAGGPAADARAPEALDAADDAEDPVINDPEPGPVDAGADGPADAADGRADAAVDAGADG